MDELEFKVIAISENTNSFGRRGYIVLNHWGVTYELGRPDFNGFACWKLNQVVQAIGKDRNMIYFVGGEIPHELPVAPQRIIDLVWGGANERN